MQTENSNEFTKKLLKFLEVVLKGVVKCFYFFPALIALLSLDAQLVLVENNGYYLTGFDFLNNSKYLEFFIEVGFIRSSIAELITTLVTVYFIFTLIILVIAILKIINYVLGETGKNRFINDDLSITLDNIIYYGSLILTFLYVLLPVVLIIEGVLDIFPVCFIPLILEIILFVIYNKLIKHSNEKNVESIEVKKAKKKENFNKSLAKAKKDAELRYQVFCLLPRILFWIIMGLYIIWSILDPIIFVSGKYYGVMRIDSFILCTIIWLLIGFVNARFVEWIVGVTTSPIIVKTEYLREIKDSVKKDV